jgi:hypothetical protein
MSRASLFAFILLAPVTAANAAEDTAARYLEWRGGTALDRVQSLSFDGEAATAGLKGEQRLVVTREYLRSELDFGNLKGTTVIGPEGAFDRTTNGQVQILGAEERETQERSVEFIFAEAFREGRVIPQKNEEKEGRSYSVMRVSYEDGDAFDYFIASDGALDWIRAQEDTDTVWVRLSDWRIVDGIRLPFGNESIRKHAAQTMVSTWESISVNPKLADGTFARPEPTRKLLSFASGNSTSIPIDLYLTVRVFVPVTINGVETMAILDSGAELSVIDAAFAAKAGVTGQGAVHAQGTGGTTTASIATNVEIALSGAKLSGLAPAIIDLSELNSRFGRPLNVIIGRELFNEAVVDVDYAGKMLTLHDAGSFTYTGSGETLSLHSVKGGLTQLEVSVEGNAPALFDFDLGNGGSIVVFHDAATRWKLFDGRKTADTIGGGVGGTRVNKSVTLSEIGLGKFTFKSVPAVLSGTDDGAFNTKTIAGNIGAGVFKKFRVLVDMTRNKLHLEPNGERISAPFDRDRGGLSFQFSEAKLTVTHVVPGGPADAVGLKKGDAIRALDGKLVTAETWAEIARDRFTQAPGTVVKITTTEGREVPVTLAEYF